MSILNVRLLGKFSARRGEQALDGLDACKVQELFCYLLLQRERAHPRESLAALLWGESTTSQSKKYLRQALWHLQTALDDQDEANDSRVLLVDAEWVQINPQAELWLDVAVFENLFDACRRGPDEEFDEKCARSLQSAVELYQGDLLEGWYQDWCLYKREELQHIFLSMLDKLMIYSEARRHYEQGLAYGERVLRYDRARERTHRRLMRLQYLAGDRTEALRQYERCVAALNQELSVKPAKRTTALYEQIRADQLDIPAELQNGPMDEHASPALPEVLGRLKILQEALTDIQRQIQQGIQAAELALKNRR